MTVFILSHTLLKSILILDLVLMDIFENLSFPTHIKIAFWVTENKALLHSSGSNTTHYK